ncbi:MAG: PAS domain S-box protein [Thermoanaerobaculia bacterium]
MTDWTESRGASVSADGAMAAGGATPSASLGKDVPDEVLKAFLEAAPGAALVLDRSYQIVLANEAMARRFGVSPEAMVGRHSLDFAESPASRKVLAGRLEVADEVFRTGQGRTFEDARGGRLLANRMEPVRDRDGRVRFAVLHSADVTAAKGVEQELRTQIAFREALATCLGSGLTAIDAQGRLVFANPAFCRMVGWSEEELLGRTPPFPYWEPEGVEAAMGIYRDVLSGEAGPRGHDIRLRHRDGTRLACRMTTAPLLVGGERIGWLASFTDLTARMRTEEALLRSEAKTRAILATALSPFLLFDVEGVVLEVNDATCRMLGLPREEVVGRSVADFVVGAPPGRIEARLATTLAHGSAQFETRVRTAGGRLVDVEVSLSHLESEGGRLVCFLHDVTGAKAAAESLARERGDLAERVAERTAELSRANEELAQASRLKDEFLASMSHELRTPLTAILGISDLLLAGGRGPLPEPQARAVGMIQESGRHLLALITDILDVSKIGAGRLDLALGWVDLRGVCESALALVTPSAVQKRHVLSLEAPTTRTLFRADERRLKQVLVNLLGNAVKFTPPGGRIELEARADEAPGEVRISVRDDGPGISAEARSRLFRPFVQLDGRLAREHEGAGLGLVLVDRLVKLHGGRVELESEAGLGSRFTVVLPWVRREPEATGAHRRVEAPRALAEADDPGSGGLKVLLVEDNDTQRALYAEALEGRRFLVETAGDGEEALERAVAFRPDVVVMDVQMPGLDGLEATRRLRATPSLARTPVLALTALAMPGDRERCREAGVDEYLAKPVPLDVLAASVRRLARGRPG